MKITQLEVSNIRFGKLDDNSRTPFSEDRLHHLCRRHD